MLELSIASCLCLITIVFTHNHHSSHQSLAPHINTQHKPSAANHLLFLCHSLSLLSLLTNHPLAITTEKQQQHHHQQASLTSVCQQTQQPNRHACAAQLMLSAAVIDAQREG